jgi:Cof subfamily protein (haloacid dehalogenase superfamily)
MAVNIRLVASDVDGTLLNPAGELTPRTRTTLARLHEAGVTFALATSRRWTAVLPIAQKLGFAIPLILCDGALIREFPSGEVLRLDPLEPRNAQLASEVLAAHELQPIAQYYDVTGEHLRASTFSPHPEWTEDYFRRFSNQIQLVDLDNVSDGAVGPLRVVAFGPVSALRRAAVALARLHVGRQLMLTGSYGMAELTVFGHTVSKGGALLHLAARFGVPLQQTLAIGDGLNDISMLRAAGLGVGMGNAPRRVRAAADVLTASNEEDGFAQALERYVLAGESAETASTPER